jgi:hypothetical protein
MCVMLWKPPLLLRAILLAAVCLGVAACAGDFAVQTARDPSVKIASGMTYAFRVIPPEEKQAGELDPRVNNSTVHDRIRQAIETVMGQKGFRRVDAATADFLVEYRIGIQGSLREVAGFRVDSRGDPMRAYSGAYTGGLYGPPPVTAIPTETTKADLLITVTDRATSRVAYRASGVDEDVTRQDVSEKDIQQAVTELLAGLP